MKIELSFNVQQLDEIISFLDEYLGEEENHNLEEYQSLNWLKVQLVDNASGIR